MSLRRYTPEEYLALVAKCDQKYEYYDGEIFAMSGGKKEHARINGNLYFELRAKLEGQHLLMAIAFCSIVADGSLLRQNRSRCR